MKKYINLRLFLVVFIISALKSDADQGSSSNDNPYVLENSACYHCERTIFSLKDKNSSSGKLRTICKEAKKCLSLCYSEENLFKGRNSSPEYVKNLYKRHCTIVRQLRNR